MKRKLIIFSLFAAVLIGTSAFLYVQKTGGKQLKKAIKNNQLHEGDIIFQSTNSAQCDAVKMVTKSDWSHCGLIFNRYNKPNDWWVLEAVQPVKWTMLKKFIARSTDGHFSIKRLKSINSNTTVGDSLQQTAEQYLGRNYDALFEWSNDNIYCSELVWKTFENTIHESVGVPQQLKDFDLSHPSVAKIAAERYGENIPWEEKVISPQAIYEANNLELVLER